MTAPLMTHDFTAWFPPKAERFYSLTNSDQVWAEPLGLGYRSQDLLYDVRDEQMNLIGYTRQKPTRNNKTAIARIVMKKSDRGNAPTVFNMHMITSIVAVQSYWVDKQEFLTWVVPSVPEFDVVVEAEWIEKTGPDLLVKWADRRREKPWFKFMMDYFPQYIEPRRFLLHSGV